jgi:hypothetical protein
VLWIRIGFNADPDPDLAFYLNANPDPDPGSQTNADPCGPGSWTDFEVKISRICSQKYSTVVISQKHTYEGRYKSIFERQATRFYLNCGQVPCSWIRILVHNRALYEYRKLANLKIMHKNNGKLLY